MRLYYVTKEIISDLAIILFSSSIDEPGQTFHRRRRLLFPERLSRSRPLGEMFSHHQQ